MNIYRLDSKAQPAPWTVDSTAQPFWDMHDYALGGECYTNQEMANALMSVHCRNNFMKALRALKECAEILDGEYPATDERNPETSGLNKIINELETVQQ